MNLPAVVASLPDSLLTMANVFDTHASRAASLAYPPALGRRTIPKGLHHSAQGCRACEATLGQRSKMSFNPERVASTHGGDDATPLGLVNISIGLPRVARSSPPWADRLNPFRILGWNSLSAFRLRQIFPSRLFSTALKPGVVGVGLLLALAFTVLTFSARASEFAFGADLSFLKQAEDRGQVFRDGTNALPGLQIFKNHGYNWIRLRVFVEPVSNNLPNNLVYTLATAADAKKLGYKFLLDLHYANSWADPGKQPTPGTWIGLSHQDRVKKVFEYTRDTVAAFRDAGVLPDMVQMGNEITHGMLWPDGKLPDHWKNFTDYLRAGIRGVTVGSSTNPPPKIMIFSLSVGRTSSSSL